MPRKRQTTDFAGHQLVRALNHPVRVKILDAYGQCQGDISPSALVGILELDIHKVAYHTKILLRCGCLEITRTELRRGAVEHFYRAVPESYLGHQLWRQVPRAVRGRTIVLSLRDFLDKLLAALQGGAADHDTTSLSAITLFLDDMGRQEAVGVVGNALRELKEADRKSRDRAAKRKTDLLPLMGGVALFPTSILPAGDQE